MNTDIKFESVIQSAEQKLSANRVPLKYLFKRAKVNATGSEELLSLYRDYGVIPKSSREDNYNRASEDLSKYQCVSPGDLVVNKMKAWQGSVAISEFSGIVSPAYYVYQPVTDFPRKYFHYLLRSDVYIREFRKLSSGVRPAQWDLDPTAFGRLPLVVPNHETANAIAGFLDRETAEIDAFIADQERLIELLEERRAATITHAVTKGLDPNAPMKDSGFAEMGPVPLHWNVSRLKWGITKIESGTSVNAQDVPVSGSHEVGVLKTSCVYTGEFDPTENKTVNAEDLHRVSCLVRADTLIVSRMNTPQLIGAAGYTSREEPNTYLPDRLWQVYFHESWETQFIHFWSQTPLYRMQIETVSTGTSSSMKNIGQDDFRNLVLYLPPHDEQKTIVSHLIQEISEFDAAIDDAREAIALSRERRAALISAAVTGQIDVCQAQRPVDEMLEEEVRV